MTCEIEHDCFPDVGSGEVHQGKYERTGNINHLGVDDIDRRHSNRPFTFYNTKVSNLLNDLFLSRACFSTRFTEVLDPWLIGA